MKERSYRVYMPQRNLLLSGISILIAICSTFYMFIAWDAFGNSNITKAVSIYLCLTYVWSAYAWIRGGHKIVSVYLAFLAYLFCSNAGQSLLYILTDMNYHLRNIYSSLSTQTMQRMMVFQASSVLWLNVGALLGDRGERTDYNDNERLQEFSRSYMKYDALFDFVFYGLALAVFVNTISNFSTRAIYGYSEYYYNERDILGNGFFFIYSIFAYRFALKHIREKGKFRLFIVLNLLIIVLSMITGNRGEMFPLIVLVIILVNRFYPKLFQKKYMLIYIAIFFVGLSLIGLISYTRTVAIGSVRLSSFLDKGLFYYLGQIIFEMGQSAFPTGLTIDYFSNGNAFQLTIPYQILLIAIPRPILSLFMTAPQGIDIQIIAPSFYNPNSGMGFSYFGEGFYNFGRFAFIFTFLWGLMITKIERKCNLKLSQGKILYPSVGFALLSCCIYYARASFSILFIYFRLTFYIIIIWFVLSKLPRSNRR